MLLNNLMEDKKLNLSRPLLSVRKHSQKDDKTTRTSNSCPVIPRPPPYRSDLKSGPVTNPGTVPFLWENTPGKPKEEITPQTQNRDKSPIAPKLPPGWYPKPNQLENSHKPDKNAKFVQSDKESSDSGNSNNEVYVDALDTLSRAESFLLNCSVSGISEIDDSDIIKPSGSFLTDSKTREFMMDRFLPAAKAMASETPQYVPKKQPVVCEEAQVKKIVNQDKPSLRYGPSFATRYSYYNKEEEEESDDECDKRENFPVVCGLLPRFCFKSSLCLLKPVPSMSARTRVVLSPANNIKPSSLSSGSYNKTENESKCDILESQPIELKENNMISLRNDSDQSEETKHAEKSRFGLDEKGFKTFQELLNDKGSSEELDVFEKTVYVDTVQKVVQEPEGDLGSRKEDNEIVIKNMDQMQAIDSSDKDFVALDNIVDREPQILPNAQKLGEFDIVSYTKENTQVVKKEDTESLECPIPPATISEESHKKYSELPIPPPLPKSPSDSWLWRTLPSMSSNNLSMRSYVGVSKNPINRFSKSSTGDFKWEAIVKSTNAERQHLCFPEEILTTIPET